MNLDAFCGGDDAVFYDYNACARSRAARGSPSTDTPFQETPTSFTAFVALQTVTAAMGAPRSFLPGTQVPDSRREFDASRAGHGAARRRCCARPTRAATRCCWAARYGDVTIFDMRLLHCGTKNLVADAGGRTRYFLNFTFCNPRADQSDLGHVPCIRPGYERRMTLATATSGAHP